VGSSRETGNIRFENKGREEEERERGIEEEKIACRHTTACNFLTTLLCLEEQNAEEGEGKGEN